ncbi:helix-turn-helix domain-containing protein [Streptomyces cellulosae]|uniref:Helix-turn-helix domain-containing protein n=1 Tax=Streptomyces cellulosae TaxID=1968 RepID=A0ABW7Y7U8_STRCE
MACTKVADATLNDLAPAGVRAARNSLVELVKGVLTRGFDDKEPRLAPALAQAAKDIADSRLTDPDLSPAVLARELNVSVRTLHRAFAAADESVSAYIRRRRLENARLELSSPDVRPSVSELAAHWRFADSSHFIRAFKKQFGQTPTQFVRSNLRPHECPLLTSAGAQSVQGEVEEALGLLPLVRLAGRRASAIPSSAVAQSMNRPAQGTQGVTRRHRGEQLGRGVAGLGHPGRHGGRGAVPGCRTATTPLPERNTVEKRGRQAPFSAPFSPFFIPQEIPHVPHTFP